MRAVECYRDALPMMRPPGERVAIDFSGHKLFGVLRKPEESSCPVVVMAPGLELHEGRAACLRRTFPQRGIATLAIDGPGQGEAEYELRSAATTSARRAAVVDWIEKRKDLDSKKMAIWGVSLGGYYAPRAAAYEKRFKDCIALSGPFEWAQIWDGLPELHARDVQGAQPFKKPGGSQKAAAALTLKDAAKKHHLPDLHRRRTPGPTGARIARRDARESGIRAGRAIDGRGRRPQRQQPSVPLPQPLGRLAAERFGLPKH